MQEMPLNSSEDKCDDCEEPWAICECHAYCEQCGKHEDRCKCWDYNEEWEDETDDDE